MRLRPSLLVLPILAIALLATGCFESTTAGTVSTPFTVGVGTGQTVVNPRSASGTPATSSSTATSTANRHQHARHDGDEYWRRHDRLHGRPQGTFATTCGGCHTLDGRRNARERSGRTWTS